MKYTFLVLLVMKLMPGTQESCMDARGICMGNKCCNMCALKITGKNTTTCQHKHNMVAYAARQNTKECEVLKEVSLHVYQRWMR